MAWFSYFHGLIISIFYIHTHTHTHSHTYTHTSHFLYPFICWGTLVHVLATVNTIAMNMGMQISLWNSEFTVFRKIPRSGIVGSYDSSLLNFFEGPLILFSIVVPVYIPTNMHKDSLFSIFLPTLHTSHSNRYEVILWSFSNFPSN